MINRNMVQTNVDLNSKEKVFEYLSKLLVKENKAKNPEDIFNALSLRESEGTTGMMDGFAIPHAKSEYILEPTIAMLKLKNPIDWDSMDGLPTQYVFALFIPEDEAGTTHLTLLSKLSRLLMKDDFKANIKSSNDSDEIYELLQRELF